MSQSAAKAFICAAENDAYVISTFYRRFHCIAVTNIHSSENFTFGGYKYRTIGKNAVNIKNKSSDIVHYFFITFCHYLVLIVLVFYKCLIGFYSIKKPDAFLLSFRLVLQQARF